MRQTGLRREALWQAFNKAENTFVGALTNERGRLLAEEDTQVLVAALRNAYLMRVRLAFKTDLQVFVGDIEAVIHQVTNQVTVNCFYQITGLDTGPVGGAIRYDLTHPPIHFWHCSDFLNAATLYYAAAFY